MAILYAKNAVLARARMLTDFKWTPACDVPTYTRSEGNGVLPAGIEVTGFPYSSIESTDKFITENVSVETFLSVIPNPDSVFYRAGRGAFGTMSYGLVCNGLVRYALGIPERISTKRWNAIPGMRTISPKGEYSVDEMELCDVLYAFNDGRYHVALITDLVRDEAGHVTVVEVSEAVRPHCKRRRFTPEEYYEKYKPFALQRYDFLDDVPSFDVDAMTSLLTSGIDKKRPRITVDNGDKSNYLEGEAVTVSVCTDAPDTVEILKDGAPVKAHIWKNAFDTIPVGARAIFSLTLPRGYYIARLKNAGSEVHFAVVGASLSHTVKGDEITVFFDAQDEKSRPVHFDLREKGKGSASLAECHPLTEEEAREGHATRKIHPEGENYKVYFRNEYGIWTMPMKPVFESE